MNSSGYGGRQQGYEAPACVQNAMMTKDKKPFTYTPGGIDLSQIKSDRMAKRLARNAQAEGVTGASQQNRPTQPITPPGQMSACMGAASLGMPFQVLPPPPPMSPMGGAGKKTSNGAPAPPPPPPCSSNNTQQNTLAPPLKNGAPGSPNAARKPMAPQRFEPPPLGFRPEIKIPTNPMAALRKVPPPVEKNTFWKDEYVKDRSKSPMVEEQPAVADQQRSTNGGTPEQSYVQQQQQQQNNHDVGDGNMCSSNQNNSSSETTNNDNDDEDGFKKSKAINENSETTNKKAEQQAAPAKPQDEIPPPAASPQLTLQQSKTPPPPAATPPTVAAQATQQAQSQAGQESPRPDARSVANATPPAAKVFTRQTESPRSETATPPQQQQQQVRATESPFRFAQQQQQQQRAPQTISPLAQPQQTLTPSPSPATNASPQPAAGAVPWRTPRNQPSPPQQTAAPPMYNNIQQQGPQGYQGPKPTNVGSLYIAPLAAPTEPQAQNLVRQQQQQYRESPMRQMPQAQQQQQQPQGQPRPPAANWMRTQPQREQPEWARGGDVDGNVVPSSLNRMKSPPPAAMPYQQQQTSYQAPQQAPNQYPDQQQSLYQAAPQGNGNGFGVSMNGQNFGAHMGQPTGLRLQINTQSFANNNNGTSTQGGPREHIIPIQLEQTPTYTPLQPNYNAVGNSTPAGYVLRSPNQFVDQGYNNYNNSPQQQQQQQQQQRVMSPTFQLNAPRMIQQQQQQGGPKTRIVPIAFDGGDAGTRGPISQTPIVIQNDPRSPPVQSKSFRILQKITDTDDREPSSESPNALANSNNGGYIDEEPKLHHPQFARQMSAQQARNSPTIDQMRKMQISQQQQQPWTQGGPTNRFNGQQQRPAFNNDMQQQYIPASQQQVPEPKIYTGSAIPSRSFKILQAMTTPENAGPGQSDL